MKAGIEAGGTKFVCGIGTGPRDLHDVVTFPTTTPDETLERVEEFLQGHVGTEPACCGQAIDAIGIACFGPLDLRRSSSAFGSITSTPKPGWQGTALLQRVSAAFGLPVGIDTDVNGAALGEYRWGANSGTAVSAYVTVGTGVGGGIVVDGKPIHGLLHPEVGHILVRRHSDDTYGGHCPFHRDCVEGLAAGPAIEGRWGRRGEALGDLTDEAVEIIAFYISQLAATMTYVASPERIALGGGVMKMAGLLDAVRAQTQAAFGGALSSPALTDGLVTFLVSPELGDRAGVLGAIALADQAGLHVTRPGAASDPLRPMGTP